MTWRPKSVVCLSYYNRFRFRSDAFAALVLALQIFPLAIAVAVATGVQPLYGISCTAFAILLASALGDSKIRVTAPNIIFVTVASSIVAREGIPALSLSTLLAGVLLMFFGAIGLGAGIQTLPRPVAVGFSTGIAVLLFSQQVPNLLGVGSQIVEPVRLAAFTHVRYPAQIELHAIVFAVATLILIVAGRGLAANLTGELSNSNGELFIQGGVNVASAFAGGLPVSGVPSHTLDNARFGAQTPIAGILQAVFLVVFLLLIEPLLRFIPVPVISALLLSSVFRMTNWQEVLRLIQVPRIQAAAWVATSLLMIVTDFPIAIAVGMLIGMFLYIRKKPAIRSKAAPDKLH